MLFLFMCIYIARSSTTEDDHDCKNGVSGDCYEEAIDCTEHDDTCTVSCSSEKGCMGARIQCASSQCSIHCTEKSSCLNTTIYAANASSLEVTGCTTDESCWNMTVYCPQSTCTLIGDDDLGGPHGITLYAINSWNDITFETKSKTQYYSGSMHCGSEYE